MTCHTFKSVQYDAQEIVSIKKKIIVKTKLYDKILKVNKQNKNVVKL